MSWDQLFETLHTIFVTQMGFLHLTPGHILMWCVGLFFMWLATAKNPSSAPRNHSTLGGFLSVALYFEAM